MLKLVTSNSFELLRERFVVQELQADSLFDPTSLVVPSLGIAQALQHALARQCGVSCNLRATFVAQFVWELIEAELPDVADSSPVPNAKLRWAVYHCLSAPKFREFQAIAQAIREPVNRWHLACQFARQLSQLIVYRPAWLSSWMQGKLSDLGAHESWQAQVWKDLSERFGLLDRAHPFERYFTLVHQGSAAVTKRVVLFALDELAPLYAGFFERLASYCDVTQYVLAPSESLVESGAAAKQEQHPLLASWGRLASFAQAQSESLTAARASAFLPPAADCLLNQLQSDLLANCPPQRGGSAMDASLQFHGCHTLLRQLEVLHNQVLDAFASMPDLLPSEVLIVTPQFDRVAPLAQAVFASHAVQVPLSLAGYTVPQPALSLALEVIFSLGESRLEAQRIVDLLREEAVAAAFGIAPDEVGDIALMLDAAGARWGLNGQSRMALDLPFEPRHSLSWALARLSLGVIQAPSRAYTERIAGLVPQPQVTGLGASLLGRLVAMIAQLQQLGEVLGGTQSAAQWRAWSLRVLQTCFKVQTSGEQEWLARAQGALDALRHAEDLVLEPAVFRAWFFEQLREPQASSMPSGAVCLAPLGELGGLPYRAIFCVGLDEASFARSAARAEHDLMAHHFQPGDPDTNASDLHTLLKLVHSAQERLSFVFNTRSAQSNQCVAPITPLNELLGVAAQMCAVNAKELVHEHPIQAFSAAEFSQGSGSFHVAHAEAARALQAQHLPVATSALTALAGPPRIDELIAFLSDPAKFYLQKRLGIGWQEEDTSVSEIEPFGLSARDTATLRRPLLAGLGSDAVGAHSVLTELSQSPHGEHAARKLVATSELLQAFLRTEAALLEGSARREFSGPFGTLRADYFAGKIVHTRAQSLSLGSVAWAMVHQLVAASAGQRCTVQLLSLDGILCLAPSEIDDFTEDAERTLQRLGRLWLAGTQAPMLIPTRAALAVLLKKRGYKGDLDKDQKYGAYGRLLESTGGEQVNVRVTWQEQLQELFAALGEDRLSLAPMDRQSV